MLTSSLKEYKKVMELLEKGLTPRNQEGKHTSSFRRWKRVKGPSTWFRKVPEKDQDQSQGSQKPVSQMSHPKQQSARSCNVHCSNPTRHPEVKTPRVRLSFGIKSQMQNVENTGITIQVALFKSNCW